MKTLALVVFLSGSAVADSTVTDVKKDPPPADVPIKEGKQRRVPDSADPPVVGQVRQQPPPVGKRTPPPVGKQPKRGRVRVQPVGPEPPHPDRVGTQATLEEPKEPPKDPANDGKPAPEGIVTPTKRGEMRSTDNKPDAKPDAKPKAKPTYGPAPKP